MNAFLKLLGSVLLILYYWLESMVLTLIPKRLRYKDVSNETVLVTGSGSGIGRLIAVRFAKLGARLVLWDVNRDGNEETKRLVQKAGGEAFTYYCDISDRQMVYSTAAKVKDEVGKVTILVNNAGIVSGKRFLDTPDDKMVKTMEVNILSHFWTCKAFLPDMIAANHGHIVSISSVGGLGGGVRLADYCASKFAAVGFEESLYLELQVEGYTGIHSTIVCPFYINTGMFAGVQPGIFGFLEPEFVADETMAAILTNQEMLILPKFFYLLYTLKTMMPMKPYNQMFQSLGGDVSMNHFTGREKQA